MTWRVLQGGGVGCRVFTLTIIHVWCKWGKVGGVRGVGSVEGANQCVMGES